MTEPSAAITEANARLMARRAAIQQERAVSAAVETAVSPSLSIEATATPRDNGRLAPTAVPSSSLLVGTGAHSAGPNPSLSWLMVNAVQELRRRQSAATPAQPQTAVSPPPAWALEQIQNMRQTAVSQTAPNEPAKPGKTAVSTPLPIDGIGEVKVWPALATALKKEGYAPHYRLALAAQAIDPSRSGGICVATLREKYTNKNGKNGRFYMFTWRRVRQLLNEGDGRLWNWDRTTNRIYLRSPQRMVKTGAVALSRIGRAVMVPASVLFAGQGKFNAHMHAAWLSANGDEGKPISQEAIAQATAVSERTQRHYNHVAGVQRQTNLEIGTKHTETTEEETAWKHGRNSFEFVDYHGRRGQPNGRYRARRLPDSYKRRHKLAANGRRRKINREIADLVTNVERGFSGGERLTKRYHTNGGAAARAFNRNPEQPTYWPSPDPAGAYRVWFSL